MESYDISHTAGQDMVASMVVFADGKPLKRDYRRFQVKTLDHADDLRALQEVLQRRMQRYLDGDEHFPPLPDLLLMDGGHLQAQATLPWLESMGIHIPILGMVKDDRHRTRALVTPEGRELGIQQSPPLFALVGRVQEEVHRFAIAYHHEKHSRSAMTSRLDGIPTAMGDVRRKHPTPSPLKAISEAELVQLEALLPRPPPVRYTTISMRKTPERRGPAKMAGPLLSSDTGRSSRSRLKIPSDSAPSPGRAGAPPCRP